jgi:hypothetical protein
MYSRLLRIYVRSSSLWNTLIGPITGFEVQICGPIVGEVFGELTCSQHKFQHASGTRDYQHVVQVAALETSPVVMEALKALPPTI